jgi:hypothetical protein
MGQGGQARRRLEKELLDALDVLAGHFNMLPKEKGSARGWADRPRLPLIN